MRQGSVNYNPDILTCLANLSNDEVFTPPTVANQMLDLLPPEIWQDETVTFLDPVAKSGVFLREIAKRLIKGLETKIPDLQVRLNHIYTRQIYGIAITELTALMSRRSLYCSKHANGKYSVAGFYTEEGNVRFERGQHVWKNGKCVFCGASQEVYDRGEGLESHAYEFIHTEKPEEIFGMKFDVIVGNPPYQLSDGGSGTGISAMPLYHKFVQQAKKLNPRYLTMIIPARWYAGGKGLDDFRNDFLTDRSVSTLVDFEKSRECFPGVDVAGGICYFLWERDYDGSCSVTNVRNGQHLMEQRRLNEFPILIRDNMGVRVVRTVLQDMHDSMVTVVFPRNPFGFTSSYRGSSKRKPDFAALITSAGESYVPRSSILRNQSLVDCYKVIIGKVNPDRGGVNNASDGKANIITRVRILSPNEVMSETYLLLSCFSDAVEADNCANFFRTKFARYLIGITLSSMNITRENFRFVPVLDWKEDWTDEKLYAKFGLSEPEIEHIENTIRPMEFVDG